MSDTLASLLLNEASTFTIRGVGTYTGPESILEYLLITRPTFNQGALIFLHKQFELIEWVGDMAVVEHTDTTSASGASSLSESMYRGTFAFAPGVARLHAVHAEPVALFSLLDVDTFSGRALCEQAAAVCPGELYPFASVAECLDVMATLPTTCPDADNLLAGDTIACRYLHLGSSRLNGLVHCPHLRNESTKCYAARCPSATRTAPAPVGDDGGDASLRAVLFAEMAAAVLVFTCFLGSWCSWRHVRRTPLMAHVKARPAAELAGAEALPMPALRGRGFELEIGGKVILRTDLKLGGCRMTAIESTSGFGKSTMFKLLAGARLPYAKFCARGGLEVVGGNVNYCPQDSSFWPEEMRVRDVLLFSAQLHGTRIDDHWETLDALGMTSCLDKLHGQLSGGQKQCMNVAATVMRSTPCLMLLDEPLSALDEQKSLNVLRQLKSLPHSFVVTVHKPSEEVHALFDRVVVLKAEGGGAEPRAICGRKGSITGEYFGLPLVELAASASCCIGGVLIGNINRPITTGVKPIETAMAAYVPMAVVMIPAGLAFVSSFQVSLIYGSRERHLVEHFAAIGSLHSGAYTLCVLLRSAFFGTLLTLEWVCISHALMDLPTDNLGTVLGNTALFTTSWIALTFVITLLGAIESLSVHGLMGLCCFSLFFTGVFLPFDQSYTIFKVFSYANPLFHVVMSNVHASLAPLDTGCPPASHPGQCASFDRLLEMRQMPFVPAYQTQIISVALFALVGLLMKVLLGLKRAPTPRKSQGGEAGRAATY